MKPKRKTIQGQAKRLAFPVCSPPMEYEEDFVKWTRTQARLLKHQEFDKLDIRNLVEEIESLGRTEKRALQSYLEVLLMHLLKMTYQPKKCSKSWELSIKHSRMKFKQIVKENPSLRSKLDNYILDSYESARLEAALETGLDEKTFPMECPWKRKQIEDDAFFGA